MPGVPLAGPAGEARARSLRRFVLPFIRFAPDSLAYSVALFLKQQCDRTLGGGQLRRTDRRRDLARGPAAGPLADLGLSPQPADYLKT